MFSITGTINGKTYNEEIISAEELADFFDLPVKKDDKNHFRVHASATSIDLATGKPRGALTVKIPTLISGRQGNNSFIIQYFQNRTWHEVRKAYTYQPRKLALNGMNHVFAPDAYEQAVLACLSPICATSPFTRRRQQFEWTDPSKEARQRIKEERMRTKYRDLILNDHEAIINAVARGYRHQGHKIPNSKLSTSDDARYALLQELDKFPKSVADAYGNPEVRLLGSLQAAIDHKQIIGIDQGNNQRQWVFSDDHGGGIIGKTNGPDHFAGLVQIFTTTGDRYSYITRLKEIQGSDEVAKETENSEKNKKATGDPLALIREAVLKQVITYLPEENRVYLLNEKGQIEDNRALKIIEDSENWMSELAQSGAIAMKRIAKELKNRD